ncbi:hypothetical protein CLOHYLEM_04810 [[Clostridium] hylemonae DSM 15053]|uniref:Uncharacterized protein n=1 Tax=[Clostridium] hylemonae DSM 15053 TaxID=553973 RepID=C0BYC1_9FIRM|nr:hypothetical protein CLOHYLEM_04810 [[Clostridium] hylemonae DSM 15053]
MLSRAVIRRTCRPHVRGIQIVVTFNEFSLISLAVCSLTFKPCTLKIFIEHEKKAKEGLVQ